MKRYDIFPQLQSPAALVVMIIRINIGRSFFFIFSLLNTLNYSTHNHKMILMEYTTKLAANIPFFTKRQINKVTL